MKLISLAFAALGLTIAATSCGQKKTSDTSSAEETKEKKVLVAYFSATGTTKKVAEEIAKTMDGTLFEIVPETPYTEADLDWRDEQSRSTLEMKDKSSRPAIKSKVPDIDKYDVVFLGYPVWWYVAPTIINTFVEENNLKGKEIICFATSGGSPIEPCVEALEKDYPDLKWEPGKLLNNVTATELETWKKELGL